MAGGYGTGCSISPLVSVIDGARRVRRRRMNHTTTPIKVVPTTPPMMPPSILPRFGLVCEIEVDDGPDPDGVGEEVSDEPDPDAVGEKVVGKVPPVVTVALHVTSGVSE